MINKLCVCLWGGVLALIMVFQYILETQTDRFSTFCFECVVIYSNNYYTTQYNTFWSLSKNACLKLNCKHGLFCHFLKFSKKLSSDIDIFLLVGEYVNNVKHKKRDNATNDRVLYGVKNYLCNRLQFFGVWLVWKLYSLIYINRFIKFINNK